MDNMLSNNEYAQSRPVWGAWIEMLLLSILSENLLVAPRMGRVD